MYIPDDLIEEIRSRNDIVDVISSYIKLQKKGGSYFGLCPFHNEKSPSFSVSPHKQMFYCFGCGEGGNVFSFLMKYDSMTFTDAVRQLAERAGVGLPDIEENPGDRRKNDLKNMILDINREAARYFHYILGTETGNNAVKYLNERCLGEDTVKKFGLGVSPVKSDSLYRYMKNKGYTDEVLKETGLFIYDDRGVYDRFRNRVMFPIINISNKVIGFGGRVMGKGEPKYLNTPETAVFDKGHNLYGLNIAKNARKNNIIICEGYMDVISMHQAGFCQAVASLGTALTEGQAGLIKRYVQEVLICYDSDGPGVKAALRAIDIFRRTGLRCRVINMEPYKDADEFIKKEGAESFSRRIDNAENGFMFEIRILERNYDMNDPAGRTAFYNETAKKLAAFSEELERDSYTSAVADKYFISAASLRKLTAGYAASRAGIREPVVHHAVTSEKDSAVNKSQRMILTWIADDKEIYYKIKNIITADDFTSDIYKKVAGIMFSEIENGTFNPATVLNHFQGDENHNEISLILNTSLIDDDSDIKEKERALNDAVYNIKRNSLEMKSRKAEDVAELQEIFREQSKLSNMHISLN